MRPLIIDDALRAKLQVLVDYAETHRLTIDDLLDIKNKQMLPPGDNSNHVVLTEFGYRVVFSIETQNQGFFRHLSVSVPEPCKLPNDVVVREIMTLLGYKTILEKCVVGFEDIGPDHQAIYVYEKID